MSESTKNQTSFWTSLVQNNAYFDWLRCCCIAMLCFYCGTALAASPQAPSDTKIIDNFSSLGIDQPQPRFAWILHDTERGQIQTAYQVMVVTKTDNFENSNNVVWNSGKQLSNEQYGIVYSGKPLLSTTRYWWKVRTWNKDNVASPWSTPVSFVTGFLRPGDWAANTQWIRLPEAISKEVNPLPMFRKEFTVSKKVSSAWLYISGLGQFNSFLNGEKIGDNVIDPAWTDYSKTVNYVTFDLTSKLRTGKNVIGVMLGNGLFARKGMRDFGPLVMIAQLHINFADGTSTDIVSDNTWKAKESPFTLTNFDATEHYDARLAVEGWDSPGLDDREWENAVAAKAPEGKLIAQSSPPVTARKTFEPVKISSPAPGILVYDFGQNMSGTFDVVLRGQRGAVVTIFPGEAITADGRIIQGRTTGCLYTLNGKGDEHWRLSFSSIGFRYLEFRDVATETSASTLPVVGKVNAQFVYTASRETGSFRASDPRYNQIFDMLLNGLRSNMISIHTDGPNYERLGWQEVVHTIFPSSSYYFDLHNLYSKIVEDVKSAQRVSGVSTSVAPNYWLTEDKAPAGPFDDSPSWGASMIVLPWQLYQVYGDSSILRNALPNMKKYLAYLKTRETPEGVVNYGLGDWMAPGGTSVPNVAGSVYVLDTKIMYEATKLFKTQDASYFKDEYERVRAAYNRKYYDQDNKTYLPASQANLSMPLAFGIVPEADRKAVMEQLVNVIGNPVAIVNTSRSAKPEEFGPVLPDHITTGDIGTTYLWRTLGDAGQADLVQKMIMQEERPSYWSMIKYGFTTLPENWNYPKTRSNNHDMYAGIFEWFFRSLGGISAVKPGYEEIALKAIYPKGLDSVSITSETIRGLIRSSWTNKNGRMSWKVTVPVNSRASVYIPYAADRTIAEGGKKIWINDNASGNVNGVKWKGLETDVDSGKQYIVWTVGSGNYEFTW